MKSLKNIAFLGTLAMVSVQAHAQVDFCEAGLRGTSNRDILIETKIGEHRSRYGLEIVGYDIEILELISKDPSSPTLSLNVKDSDGPILTTMLPALGRKTGERQWPESRGPTMAGVPVYRGHLLIC